MVMDFQLFESKDSYKANKELQRAVEAFANAIRNIGRKYPNVGIGDTAVDEAIVENVYREIHGGERNEGIKNSQQEGQDLHSTDVLSGVDNPANE